MVKSTASRWLLCLACLWTGAAGAQATSEDPSTQCPALPAEAAETLRWDAVRMPDMLYCRALRGDGGAEAFALTISRESRFRPRRGDRAEVTTANGREVQWYRGDVPNEPDVLIREALLELSGDRVMHVFMRANDAATLARRQQLVGSLPVTLRD